jgi:hypothetical protein
MSKHLKEEAMRSRDVPSLHAIAAGALGSLAVLMIAMTPSLAGASSDSSPVTGSLRVEKTVDGDGAGPFKFQIICLGFNASVLDEEFELETGGSMVFDGLPDGTECAVEEIDGNGASSTQVTPADGLAVISEYGEALVTFLNVFEPPTSSTSTTTSTSTTMTIAGSPTTTTTASSTTTTTVPSVLGAVVVVPAPAAELPRTGSDGARGVAMAGLLLGAIGVALVGLTKVIQSRRTVGRARR